MDDTEWRKARDKRMALGRSMLAAEHSRRTAREAADAAEREYQNFLDRYTNALDREGRAEVYMLRAEIARLEAELSRVTTLSARGVCASDPEGRVLSSGSALPIVDVGMILHPIDGCERCQFGGHCAWLLAELREGEAFLIHADTVHGRVVRPRDLFRNWRLVSAHDRREKYTGRWAEDGTAERKA